MTFKPGIFSLKQIDVMANCIETINILVGSVRSGKTIASLIAFLILLRSYPGCNIMLVGKSDKTLYRNVLMPLKDIVRPENFKFSRTIGEGDLYNKYHFFVSGAYDEKSFEKIQGITLALAYGDEVTAWPENYFQMLLSRLSEDNAKFIGTCNPEGPYHWLKKKFIDRENQISIKIWNFLIDENKNLPPSYVIKLKQFYTGLFYKRYIQGLWVMAEGAIYDMFSEARHVSPVTPDVWAGCYIKHVSCDYGTGNPTVFQMWGHDENRRYLLKEYYYDSKEEGKQKTDAQYANDLSGFIGSEDIQTVIIDPSAASFKVEVSQRGIPIQDAENSVIDGIRAVGSELAQDYIQVDPSCVNYIREKYGYVWDINAGKRGEDKPMKQNDHSCFVAGTMVTTDHGKIPIENINHGDMVLTRYGFKEVLNGGITSESEEIFKLCFENGNSISATKHHPIYVIGKGYIPLDAIRYGDYVLSESPQLKLKKLNSMESSSEDTPLPIGHNIETIITQVENLDKTKLGHCTKKYGNHSMVKFQKETTYIIKTVIHLTTALITSNVSHYSNIQKHIRCVTEKILKHLSANVYCVIKSDHSRKHGIPQKRVRNGILNMAKCVLRSALNKKQYVSNVVKNSSIIPLTQKPDFVQMPVKLRGEEHPGSMTKHAHAGNVVQNLESVNIQNKFIALKVVGVGVNQPGIKETVYNLTVEDAHEFFANGILCHNCDCERYYIFTVKLNRNYNNLVDMSEEQGYDFATSNNYEGIWENEA